MSADPRAALATLTAAFERHLEACVSRRGEEDPSVIAAYDDLADAFEAYDDALLETFGEMTPLEVYSGPDDDDVDESGDEGGDERDREQSGRRAAGAPAGVRGEADEGDEDGEDGEDGDFEELDDEADDEPRVYSGLDDDYDVDDTAQLDTRTRH